MSKSLAVLPLLLMLACGGDDLAGAYTATTLEATPSCYTATVPPPRMTRLELADDGSAVTTDSLGRQVTTQWDVGEAGPVLSQLKVIGWWAGEVELLELEPGVLEATIAWDHGGCHCDTRVRFTATDDRR